MFARIAAKHAPKATRNALTTQKRFGGYFNNNEILPHPTSGWTKGGVRIEDKAEWRQYVKNTAARKNFNNFIYNSNRRSLWSIFFFYPPVAMGAVYFGAFWESAPHNRYVDEWYQKFPGAKNY